LLYARDLTGRVYPESGTEISFHGGSHHAEDPGRIKQYAQLNQYHVKTLAYFIEKLRSIPEGRVKGDRHLAFPSRTVSSSNLLLSILDVYGIHEHSFGDSTGRIEGLVS
jgi:hypothetical protein